ncbi:DUF262 domain-containing protein [Pedobacter sp. FW305-3-2-15-E-R2A2]|uniref:DUF262 domain-containing protein n=1 Tax=Pedobacter sp. FW305-3-2-15-E-R2A2 TaxID=3140251 RepID=UPI003140344A
MSTDKNINDEEKWWNDEGQSENPFKEFDPKDVSVDIRNYSIGTLLRKIEHNEIDLFPDFQRKFDLWNNRLKSQLIESILLNFPIPPLYFAMSFNDRSVVIDGLQRLWTFKSFILESSFKLEGLTVLSEINGLRFSDLQKQHQRRIYEYNVVTYDLRPGVPRFVIYDIFRRLNTGGVVLNAQEIRHALNHKSSLILTDFTSIPIFKTLVKVKKNRMEDNELALRFISFYRRNVDNYQPPMSLFLDREMEYLKNIDLEHIRSIRRRFEESLILLQDLFGDQVFSKPSINYRRGKFNKALFEVLTVCFANLAFEEKNILLINRLEFTTAYFMLLENSEFNMSISTTTASRNAVLIRYGEIEGLIRRFL